MEDVKEYLKTQENNIFVLAGAGTGKTTSMVERIAYFVNKGIDSANIVAISFTNASTEDLRSKIINKLGDSDKNIDDINISTIHSFCETILKENAIVAGLSPDFVILEEKDATARKDKIFKECFRKEITNTDNYKYLAEFLDSDTIYDNVKEIYDSMTKYLDIEKFYSLEDINLETENEYLENKATEIVNEIKRLEDLVWHIVDAGRGKYTKNDIYILDGKQFIEDVNKRVNNVGYIVNKYSEGLKKDKVIYNGGKLSDKKLSDNGYFLDNLKKLIKDFFDKIEPIFLKIFYSYAKTAYDYYIAKLEENKNNIDNNQLLYLTNKLLDDKNVCLKLHEKYKYIYIDEFQDTDHIQNEIMLKLTRHDGVFYDNSVYLVGDPKQSIYRFRSAEPDVYYKTHKIFSNPKNNTIVKNIDTNYRSNDKIVRWFNCKYSKKDDNDNYINPLTDEEYVKIKFTEDNVVAGALKENELAGVYLYNGYAPESMTNSSSPSQIVKLIQYLKTKKIRDKDTKEFRNVEYKDIMLLFRNHDKMPEYVQAIDEAKIPLRIEGELYFDNDFSLRAFVRLYESLNVRGNRAIGAGKETLRVILEDSISKSDMSFADLENKLFKLYAGLKKETKGMSSYGKALYLASRLDLLVPCKAEKSAFEINKIKSKLHQMIEEVFSQNNANGEVMSKLFSDYIKNKVDREALLEPEDEVDCIRMINLHKAKGLDSPIVVWINIEGPGNNKFYFKDKTFYNTDVIEDENVLNQLKHDDDLENTRLEYVAVTRAREVLIFARDPDPKVINKLYFKEEKYSLNDLDKIEIPLDYQFDENEDTATSSFKVQGHEYNRNEDNVIKTDSPSKHESSSKIKNDLRVQEQNGQRVRKEEAGRPANNILGTLIHRSFELMVKNRALGREENIRESANQAIKESNPDIEKCLMSGDLQIGYNEYIKFTECVTKALYDYFTEKKVFETDLYPEMKFSYLKDDNTILNGSIDLLSIDGDNATIIDYKSDTFPWDISDEIKYNILEEKYKKQLDEYESTIRTLIPNIKNIKKKIIFFTDYSRKNGTIKVNEMTL